MTDLEEYVIELNMLLDEGATFMPTFEEFLLERRKAMLDMLDDHYPDELDWDIERD